MSKAHIVLRLGSALAVLVPGVGASPEDHAQAAEAALQAATGRTDIAIRRRPSGRPRLEPPYPELAVSLSYRGGLLLAGFDAERAVGVDVELADTAKLLEPLRLARDHFSANEAAQLRGVPGKAACDLFLRLWVAKEAALKVTGRGVYDGLAEPDLSPHLAALLAGVPIEVAAGPRLPALQLIVGRPSTTGDENAPYCAVVRVEA